MSKPIDVLEQTPSFRRSLARKAVSVRLAEAVAVAMEDAGVSRRQLADMLGWDVTRMRRALRGTKVADVGEILDKLKFGIRIECFSLAEVCTSEPDASDGQVIPLFSTIVARPDGDDFVEDGQDSVGPEIEASGGLFAA